MLCLKAQVFCALFIMFFVHSENRGKREERKKKQLSTFFARKTILIKNQQLILQVRMHSRLNLCITCQSASLWAGSLLP